VRLRVLSRCCPNDRRTSPGRRATLLNPGLTETWNSRENPFKDNLCVGNPAVAAVALGVHLFVVLYEEPTLRKKFGAEYEEYCRNVRRWWPRLRRWDRPH
jgi:hypothetical protein